MISIEGPVYLDANVLIYALETDGAEGELARLWLMQVDRGRVSARTSELTYLEILPHPLARGRGRLVDAYHGLLSSSPHLRTVPVTRAVLLRAAELRAEFGSEAPDAIHVATALLAGCRGVVTNDARLKLPPGLNRCELVDITALAL